MNKKGMFFAWFVFFSLNSTLYAQTSSSTTTIMPSVEFDTSTFPQWAKDLRRAEIIAFGSFPFTIFMATMAMDTTRYFNNGQDIRYAPWPLRPAGGVEMNTNERLITIGAAAAGSIVISLVDYFIVQYKRNKTEKQNRNLPDGSPIIIRRPLSGPAPGAEVEAEPQAEAEAGFPPENGEP
jgi:hypothetical protein